MDEMNSTNQDQSSPGEVTQTEEELNHTDKMMGVISEPAATYEKISHFPPKTIDWFLPMIILVAIVAITQLIVLSNPEIYFQTKQKQIAKMRDTFQQMVDKKQMTQQQADEQMDKIQERMDQSRGVTGKIIQVVSIIVMGFIFFFISSGVYFLLARFALKGEGSYVSAMVANGMTAYISVIGVIIAAILSLLLGRLLSDVSIASLANLDKSSFGGFLLGKIDIINLWALVVFSIGLAKMFKSSSVGKYYGIVFGVWIIWSLIIFGISKAVPFLGFLAG
jgi:hypothetical protein